MHDDILVLQALDEMKDAIRHKTNDVALKNKQIALACRIAFSEQSSTRKSPRYMEDIISLADSIRIIAEFLIEKDLEDEHKQENIYHYEKYKTTKQDVIDFLTLNKIIIESN